jgi:hypothetical protein
MSQKRQDPCPLLAQFKFDSPLLLEDYECEGIPFTDNYATLWNTIYLEIVDNWPVLVLGDALSASSFSIASQILFLTQNGPPSLKASLGRLILPELDRMYQIPNIVLRLLGFGSFLHEFLTQQNNIGYTINSHPTRLLTLTWKSDKWVTLSLGRDTYTITKDYFLMIFTRTWDTACALLCAHSETGKMYSKDFYHWIVIALRTIHKYYIKLGFKAFDLGKSLEALVIGYVLAKEDVNWDNSEFLKKTENDLLLKFINPAIVVDLFVDRPTVELVELAELAKLFGHPHIRSEEGISKLVTRNYNQKQIDVTYLTEVRNMLTRDFCKSYF